LSNHNQ